MKPKNRKVVIVCLIIFAASLVVAAISTVIQIIHNGWSNLSLLNIAPFIGMSVAMISALASTRDKKEK